LSFLPGLTGHPQGSPVSPLRFVIYFSSRHIPVSQGLVLSYVDNSSITTSSPMYRSNSRALQSIFGCLREVAHVRHVDFSVPMTELIHWPTPMVRDPRNVTRPPRVGLDGQPFHPSPMLRWLGYWFVGNLASSAHFSCRLALSQAAFALIRHLFFFGSWVSPHLCHRLAFSLLFHILSYGADLFVPSKGLLSKMDVHWRQVQR